jgi:hypothetical protein
MTNWLNAQEVKAAFAANGEHEDCHRSFGDCTAPLYFVEAIALMPNPVTQDTAWNFQQMQTIWTIARIVTGFVPDPEEEQE